MKSPAIFIILLGLAPPAIAVEQVRQISPDGRFVTRISSRNSDGTGSRLVLSAVADSGTGVLIRENDRWIEVRWSSDSKFLAVTDGSDGHITDVFIYRVQKSDLNEAKVENISFQSFGSIARLAHAPGIQAELWYHTPNVSTYDTQWEFMGWAQDNKSIRITSHTRQTKDKTLTADLKAPISPKNSDAEQGGADQPAPAPDSKAEGKDKSQSKSKPVSR